MVNTFLTGIVLSLSIICCQECRLKKDNIIDFLESC